jgi:hypothetical protein
LAVFRFKISSNFVGCRRLMQAALVALARAIAGWMAIDAAWMRQHFTGLGK